MAGTTLLWGADSLVGFSSGGSLLGSSDGFSEGFSLAGSSFGCSFDSSFGFSSTGICSTGGANGASDGSAGNAPPGWTVIVGGVRFTGAPSAPGEPGAAMKGEAEEKDPAIA